MSIALVVDDDLDIRQLVTLVAQRAGCEVIEASSGAEALAAALRVVPDIVILDVAMPGISGLDVCAQLRRNLTTRDVPVLMLSAAARPSEQAAGLASGADLYLTKPFSPAALAEQITRLMAQHARAS
ncbi:MAG TPA: response regulator [Pedococcus sp.]|jgi:DNA-binding response OmpR family regulator|nr:response regulator [Pedococcus sp.]